jgi:hypothetical protein
MPMPKGMGEEQGGRVETGEEIEMDWRICWVHWDRTARDGTAAVAPFCGRAINVAGGTLAACPSPPSAAKGHQSEAARKRAKRKHLYKKRVGSRPFRPFLSGGNFVFGGGILSG